MEAAAARQRKRARCSENQDIVDELEAFAELLEQRAWDKARTSNRGHVKQNTQSAVLKAMISVRRMERPVLSGEDAEKHLKGVGHFCGRKIQQIIDARAARAAPTTEAAPIRRTQTLPTAPSSSSSSCFTAASAAETTAAAVAVVSTSSSTTTSSSAAAAAAAAASASGPALRRASTLPVRGAATSAVLVDLLSDTDTDTDTEDEDEEKKVQELCAVQKRRPRRSVLSLVDIASDSDDYSHGDDEVAEEDGEGDEEEDEKETGLEKNHKVKRRERKWSSQPKPKPMKMQATSQPRPRQTEAPQHIYSEEQLASLLLPVPERYLDLCRRPSEVVPTLALSAQVRAVLRDHTHWQIVCHVDHRERNKRSQSPHNDLVQLLVNQGHSVDTDALALGDVLWTLRYTGSLPLPTGISTPLEVIGECVVERKNVQDLANSIVDGRFKEQKRRLILSGIPLPVLLVEGIPQRDLNKMSAISGTTLHTAMATTIALWGMKLLQTTNMGHTAETVVCLHSEQEQRKAATLDALARGMHPLVRFDHFQQQMTRVRKNEVIGDIFRRQLYMVPGLGPQKAETIANQFPTCAILLEHYKHLPPEARAHAFKNWKVPGSTRSVGPVVSTRLFHMFCGRNFDAPPTGTAADQATAVALTYPPPPKPAKRKRREAPKPGPPLPSTAAPDAQLEQREQQQQPKKWTMTKDTKTGAKRRKTAEAHKDEEEGKVATPAAFRSSSVVPAACGRRSPCLLLSLEDDGEDEAEEEEDEGDSDVTRDLVRDESDDDGDDDGDDDDAYDDAYDEEAEEEDGEEDDKAAAAASEMWADKHPGDFRMYRLSDLEEEPNLWDATGADDDECGAMTGGPVILDSDDPGCEGEDAMTDVGDPEVKNDTGGRAKVGKPEIIDLISP